jgi:hypothetical protein
MRLQLVVYGTLAGLIFFGVIMMEAGAIMHERTIALSILDHMEVCR